MTTASEITAPLCPTCGKSMHVDRIAARVLGYPEVSTYTCPACWGEAVTLAAHMRS